MLPVYTTGIIILFVAALSMGCGCFKTKKPHQFPLKARQLALIKNGNEFFFQKKYDKASEIYKSLLKDSQNIEIKRLAAYGLACTSLTVAETVDEQEAAIRLWDQWMDQAGCEFSEEDPRLLGPYIQKTTPPCQKDAEILLLRERNSSMKKEITDQKNQIATLKNQISSLEAIDQKIKEKKKEISAP
jgi:hypothetical protein